MGLFTRERQRRALRPYQRRDKMPPKSPSNYNSNAAARRVAEKAKRDEFRQLLSKLDPEFVTKLRVDCLRTANEQLRGASPEEVVREAGLHFESRVRFLMEKSS